MVSVLPLWSIWGALLHMLFEVMVLAHSAYVQSESLNAALAPVGGSAAAWG